MNEARFFDGVRKLAGTLSASQVAGFNVLLAEGERRKSETNDLAYKMATSWHETGFTMQPIHERGAVSYFNKYEPGTKIGKALGNALPGDGYRYRGRGYVQLTGRRNYELAKKKIGVDFVGSPDLALVPANAARILFAGMDEGWFTGRADRDYIDALDESDAEDGREYTNARRVVNGTDKAAAIAAYALKIEAALRAAGYNGTAVAPPVATPAPKPAKPVAKTNWLAALIAALFSIFRKKADVR